MSMTREPVNEEQKKPIFACSRHTSIGFREFLTSAEAEVGD